MSSRKALRTRTERRATREARWVAMAQLWNDGVPMQEAADSLNMSRGYFGVEMVKMRRAGWVLPYRRQAYADVPFGDGDWQARRAALAERRGSVAAAVSDLQYIRRDPCSYCDAAGGTIDHIVPREHGGPDGWENATAACGPCNTAKRERSLLRFLAVRAIDAELAPLRDARQAWMAVM